LRCDREIEHFLSGTAERLAAEEGQGGAFMAIAVEVARATGWREIHFPGINCRDLPMPPTPTLNELMERSLAYAQATQRKLRAELKEGRRKRRQK